MKIEVMLSHISIMPTDLKMKEGMKEEMKEEMREETKEEMIDKEDRDRCSQ
jgi:hypothetical protein